MGGCYNRLAMQAKEDTNILYWAAIGACPQLGSMSLFLLWSVFKDGEKLWKLGERELRDRGVPEKVIASLINWRSGYDIERLGQTVEKLGLKVLMCDSKEYPALLKEISDPPVVLYVRGHLEPDAVAVSVVGSRKASAYGLRMVDRIVRPIVRSGVVVVSGLALGIDGAAHRAVLENGGKTVAVLAHGLEQVCPTSHYQLAREIVNRGGALVSEYAPGTQVQAYYFLARNRIIAGLSMGTILVEAGEKSGALTTAREAIENGREVLAVPGDAERDQSTGVNNLLKQGAIPVTTGEEVLSELNLTSCAAGEVGVRVKVSDDEKRVLDGLSKEPIHIDKLAVAVNLDIVEVNCILVNLELRGLVKNAGGAQFIKG